MNPVGALPRAILCNGDLAPLIRQGKFGAVVPGMLDRRNNAYVEAMNGLLQQAKRAARGYRDAGNFISIAYLRMSKLKHIPPNPLELAAPLTIPNGSTGVLIHRCL